MKKNNTAMTASGKKLINASVGEDAGAAAKALEISMVLLLE